jgi:hypothetical protein
MVRRTSDVGDPQKDWSTFSFFTVVVADEMAIDDTGETPNGCSR